MWTYQQTINIYCHCHHPSIHLLGPVQDQTSSSSPTQQFIFWGLCHLIGLLSFPQTPLSLSLSPSLSKPAAASAHSLWRSEQGRSARSSHYSHSLHWETTTQVRNWLLFIGILLLLFFVYTPLYIGGGGIFSPEHIKITKNCMNGKQQKSDSEILLTFKYWGA